MRIPYATRSWRWIMIMMVAVLCATGARAANVAAGKPAFASYKNENAGLVTDNNESTLWQPSGSPSTGIDWVAVDLGSPVVLKAIRVYFGDTRPTGFLVQAATTVSSDPNAGDFGQGNWTTVNTFAGPGSPESPYFVEMASNTTAYRYVRVSATAAPNADWGVRELQALDTPLPRVSGVVKFGSAGVPETIVTLAGPSGLVKQEVDASGAYSFGGLESGAYTVRAIAAGKYAPVSATVNVADTNVTKDLTFTTPVVNTTAPLVAYSADFIASGDNPNDQTASVDALAMPVELLPPGNAVWNTSTPLPPGAEAGSMLPSTLKFFIGPTADKQNNVLSALNVSIPFAPANYTAIYFLQTGVAQNYYTTVTLHYQDGTSEVSKNPAGSTQYGITVGANAPATPDELIAFTLHEMYEGESFPVEEDWNVFIRAVTVDPTKVLTSVEFNGILSGPGSGTMSRGYLLGWSADSLAAPPAVGSISGVIKAPGGAPVAGAIVTFGSFRTVTDASGAYKFNSLPAGTWTVSARKPAFYGVTSKTVTLTAGQNATGQDIQFAAPAAIMATGIGAPQVDLVSTDANYTDFQWTSWMMGREYFPTGLWKPADGGNMPYFEVQAGAPDNLPILFTDFGDTPIKPGDPGYPAGGTPNLQLLGGSTFLAPPVKTTAVYIATIGAEGSNVVNPQLVYTDGTRESGIISIGDWFGAPTPDEYPYIRMHGRHYRGDPNSNPPKLPGEANFAPDTNIRLNVVIINVNPAKQLQQVEFGQYRDTGAYPVVLGVSWETETVQPAPSDVVVTVKKADNSAAAGAIVMMGPYNTRADANGVARFIGIPANLPVSLGAYISGVTKQVRKDHTVAVGRTIAGGNPDTASLTLPAEAPIFVQLPLAVDHDAFAMPDMPGDYKTGRTNDRGVIGEVFPASLSTSVVANVPYRMPIKETFYNNVFRVHGQSLKVVPGNYSSLDFAVTGPGVGAKTRISHATMRYADGTSEKVQYGVTDWVKAWDNIPAVNRELYWRMINLGTASPFYSPGRRGPANDDTAKVSFPTQPLPINAAKTLVSIDFLPFLGGIENEDFEILAATLEANAITGQTGTITGRVIGKPMGAEQAGPLPRTQVILGDAYAAYTDANGAFTIANAPVGAGSLKVIPYGTGIVSKSFPVNVTAGSVNVGDLNVGASVNQVSVTFGATDIENGVRLLQPTQLQTGNWNVSEARSTPVEVAGKSARETTFGRFYLDVDDGWLWRGLQGNNGLTITDRGLPTQKVPKLAPTIYVQIEYLDRGTDKFGFEMNRMERWTYKKVDTDPGLETIRLTSMWHNPGVEVTKTDTGEWKKFVLTLDPAVNSNAFGAYNGQHLMGDFLIDWRGTPDIIRKVTFSTTPDFAVESPAADILRIAGGLTAGTAGDIGSYDKDGDGKITLLDATIAAREAQSQ